jgi:hypothetical protein
VGRERCVSLRVGSWLTGALTSTRLNGGGAGAAEAYGAPPANSFPQVQPVMRRDQWLRGTRAGREGGAGRVRVGVRGIAPCDRVSLSAPPNRGEGLGFHCICYGKGLHITFDWIRRSALLRSYVGVGRIEPRHDAVRRRGVVFSGYRSTVQTPLEAARPLWLWGAP